MAAGPLVFDCAPTDSYYKPVWGLIRVCQAADGLVLQFTEPGLAAAGEDFRDGCTRRGFDFVVGVHEAPAELLRQQLPNGSLAGAHKSGQDDAPQDGSPQDDPPRPG